MVLFSDHGLVMVLLLVLLKDLILSQNRNVHLLTIKKFVARESIENEKFTENVRVFAKNYNKQKKDLLLINTNGVLCVKYPKNQRAIHTPLCMINLP